MLNSKTNSSVPVELNNALQSSEKARMLFERLAASHKQAYIDWVNEAKKEVTRKDRARKSIILIEASISTVGR